MIPTPRLEELRDEHAQTAEDLVELRQGYHAQTALDTALALEELLRRREAGGWRRWAVAAAVGSIAGLAFVLGWWLG